MHNIIKILGKKNRKEKNREGEKNVRGFLINKKKLCTNLD